MKKEKQVRTYTRRTKSGKTVTVRAHSARYDAADKKDAAKKKGAGKELEELALPKEPHPHDSFIYSPEVRKKLDEMLSKIEKMEEVHDRKYANSSTKEALSFRRKLNSLLDSYNKLSDQHKGFSKVYKEYEKKMDAYYSAQRKKEAAEEKAWNKRVAELASKKGFTYVGKKDDERVYQKNGRAYTFYGSSFTHSKYFDKWVKSKIGVDKASSSSKKGGRR